MSLIDKLRTIAQRMYDASDIELSSTARDQFAQIEQQGFGHFPVCVAKTQFSFSTDPNLKGAPSDHIISVREVRLSAGAEFVVAICGEIMTLPGLPRVPAANNIEIDAEGRVTGLF
jgi:formate--tetrahydrofolate ligase